MGKQDTLPKSAPKKFLFDQHNFDEGYVPEPEIPPPPVYSQEELDAAQKSSYDRGKKDGLAEAHASFEKRATDLLDKIMQNFKTLFAAEEQRARLYESESLYLARAIFSRLFPNLNERHGLEEVERVITDVLESHRTNPEIIIEVHPDFVESIRASVENAFKNLHGTGLCTITGNETLTPGACRLSWNDGGAVRDPQTLAEQISHILEDGLAEKPRLRDNGQDSSKMASEPTDNATAQNKAPGMEN